MARDIFGNRKITRDDRMTGRHIATNADIRWEYVKIACFLILGSLYFYYIILGG